MISITDIDNIEGPVYVMVAGGMGAGKSYIVEQYVKTIPIVDIDKLMEERGYFDYSDAHLKECMGIIVEIVSELMKNKKSFIAMGTASVLSLAIDRLYTAKANGYQTVLLYIEATVSQAMEQNNKRRNEGKRCVRQPDEHKIRRTVIGAANTVLNLKETKLVDHYCHYNNRKG